MRLRIGLLAALTAAAIGSGALAAPNPAYAADPSCSIDYDITEQWTGGFRANVVINNTSPDVGITGWTLLWEFTAGQKVIEAWNVRTVRQDGGVVTTTDAGWNANVPPRGTAEIGFTASWVGSNPEPTRFEVNTIRCSVV